MQQVRMGTRAGVGLGREAGQGIPLCVVLLMVLGGCATQPAPAPAPPPAAPAAVQSVPISTVDPVPEQPKPVKPAKPAKPVKSAKATKKAEAAAPPPAEPQQGGSDLMLQTVPSAAPASSVPPVPPPAVESAKPEQPIKGPGWLSRCASKRLEGGVILCDANHMLVPPGPGIKVFVSDPSLARTMPNGYRVLYRVGLPRLYRLFLVP